MGKNKRARKAFHLHAFKNANQQQDAEMMPEPTNMVCSNMKTGGIFSNTEIPPSLLLQKFSLPDADVSDRMSVISSISSKTHLTKKDKRTLKRQAFLLRLEATKAAEKKMELAEKRKNTPVVGDMSILSDALPTLEHLMKKGKNPEPKQMPRTSKKFKQQKKAMLEDMTAFQQVLKHPEYMADPFGTITSHVKAALQEESKNCT